MKKLLLTSLLISFLFYSSVNASEIENYSQEAKQVLLERLHYGNGTLKLDGASRAKLYDKDGNLILEMKIAPMKNEKLSLYDNSKKQMSMPWEGVPWYVYDVDGKKYEMTDAEKKEFFMEISHSMFSFVGKIQ